MQYNENILNNQHLYYNIYVIQFFSQYLYLLSGLYFLFLWIIVFILLKDEPVARKRMLTMSFVLMIITLFVEQLTLIDWWRPEFNFNSKNSGS